VPTADEHCAFDLDGDRGIAEVIVKFPPAFSVEPIFSKEAPEFFEGLSENFPTVI
jgi:hypothetical protein